MPIERTPANARIILVRQLQDALFDLSFDANATDDKNEELLDKLAIVADQVVELLGATVTQIDEDGNAYFKFLFSHVWDDERFGSLFVS